MYEEYYGFVQPPFSLTPDPRFLYRSESHDLALQQVWQAIRRKEGAERVARAFEAAGNGRAAASAIEALGTRTSSRSPAVACAAERVADA